MHDETQQGGSLEKEGNLSVATNMRDGQTVLLTTNSTLRGNYFVPLKAVGPCVGGNESAMNVFSWGGLSIVK